jgi:endonuclease YncB( thermonuclease family)
MKRPALVSLVAIAAVLALAGCPDEYHGHPILDDGDSFKLPSAHIRLFGIDAPEGGQSCLGTTGAPFPCGQRATEAMTEIIAGREVVCSQRDIDRFRRVVAVCRIDGLDIAAELVRRGWAVAYRRFSLDYVGLEDEARKAKRGIWSGTFEAPEVWRAERRTR